MADIFELKPKTNTIKLELKDPRDGSPFKNDDDTPMVIELYAPHSKEYKAIVHEQADLRIQNKKSNLTSAEMEELTCTLLVKATVSWDITFGKSKPKLTEKKAREIYDVFWVREQVEEALNTYEVFTKG